MLWLPVFESAKKNLVFHFEVGRHASFPKKPVGHPNSTGPIYFVKLLIKDFICPFFQSIAHFLKLGKLESSKSYTTVLLAICRMDIAFAKFVSTIVMKDTMLYFLKRILKDTVTVVSKAHEA